MRLLLFFVFFIVCSMTVLAQQDPEVKEICDFLRGELVQGGTIPQPAPYSNERVNAYTFDNKPVGHMIIDNRVASFLECEEIVTDPTLNLYITDVQTLQEIKNAESKVDAFDDALGDGSIRIEGISVGSKFKNMIVRAGIKVASWFS